MVCAHSSSRSHHAQLWATYMALLLNSQDAAQPCIDSIGSTKQQYRAAVYCKHPSNSRDQNTSTAHSPVDGIPIPPLTPQLKGRADKCPCRPCRPNTKELSGYTSCAHMHMQRLAHITDGEWSHRATGLIMLLVSQDRSRCLYSGASGPLLSVIGLSVTTHVLGRARAAVVIVKMRGSCAFSWSKHVSAASVSLVRNHGKLLLARRTCACCRAEYPTVAIQAEMLCVQYKVFKYVPEHLGLTTQGPTHTVSDE